jgi:phosphoglycerate dehydrogenase-like enzyme
MATSDFIFVTLPLTNDTEGLITSQKLKNLKKNAIVVNIARAGILDDAALTKLLSEDRIFGAGLDVYNPVAAKCKHPNLILTSHMANCEAQACKAVLNLAVNNIIAVLNGEPPISPVVI